MGDQHGSRRVFGEPVKRDGYGESFNGRVRDECLSINSFQSPSQARVVITGPPVRDRRLRNQDTHLLIGLGTAAAEKGYRVKYTLATRLVSELVEETDEKVLARTIARYGRVDLLIIDELG